MKRNQKQKEKPQPIEFHVKGSKWKRMKPKTKAAMTEMVMCAAKAVEEGRLLGSARVELDEIEREECEWCAFEGKIRRVTHLVRVIHGFRWIGRGASLEACERHAREIYNEWRRQIGEPPRHHFHPPDKRSPNV